MGAKLLALAIVFILAIGPVLPEGPSTREAAKAPVGEGAIQGQLPDGRTPGAGEMLSGIGDAFIENRGQLADPEVLFYTQGGRVSVGLTRDGIIVVIGGGGRGAGAAHFAIAFDGCNPVRPAGRDAIARPTSYFLGNDPSRWVRGAPSYREVAYEGLYEGVDLVLRLKGDTLKYDIELAAAADAGAVAFRYEGVQGLSVDGATGDLLVETTAGELRDGRPVVFQEGALPTAGADGRFVPRGDRAVGFGLPEGCDLDRPALIDPGLVFSTFVGGSGYDRAQASDFDAQGNILVCGYTSSKDFPTTAGSYDPVGKVNESYDGIIMRFDPSGRLLASTFIGGSAFEGIFGLRVAMDGTIVAIGGTDSNDFPTTVDALFKDFKGISDGLIFKLSNDLSDLLYSSYFGGTSYDDLKHLDFDANGYVCISGLTNSSDIPTTAGAYCQTYQRTGAYLDSIFVCQLESNLKQVRYCTYLNGVNTSVNSAWGGSPPYFVLGQSVDAQGNILLVSRTSRTTFPTTPGAFQATYRGGQLDAFVVKLDPEGGGASDLLASTFLGGYSTDDAISVLAMENGSVAVVGLTNSYNLPRVRPIDNSLSAYDGFIAVLSGDLTRMQFGTFFGGTNNELCTSVAEAAGGGLLYVMGGSGAWAMPTTEGCFDSTCRGNEDKFVVSIDLAVPRIDYCTWIGGSQQEKMSIDGHDLLVAGDGRLVISGDTMSADFPTTEGAFQTTYGEGDGDGILLKLDPTACGLPDAPRGLNATAGDGRATLQWRPHTNVGYRLQGYKVYRGPAADNLTLIENISDAVLGYDDLGLENGLVYYYGVSAVNTAGEGAKAIVSVRPLPRPPAPAPLGFTSGDGAITVNWTPLHGAALEIRGYRVMRGPSIAGLREVLSVGNATTSFRDSDVVRGVVYYYGVCAFNDAGNGTLATGMASAWSAPLPPSGFNITELDGKITLSWQKPTDDGGNAIRYYRVYKGDSPTNISRVAELEARFLKWDDRDVRNGHSYHYRVTAVSEVEGEATETLVGVPFGLPTAPRGLNATPGDGRVELGWSAPEDENGRPVTGYVIMWGREPGTLINRVETGPETNGTVALPENGVAYYFQVAAVNLAGEGPFSAEASAMPFGVPGSVKGLSCELLNGSVKLVWNPPSDTGGAASLRYIISRRAPDLSWAKLGETSGVCEYLDDGTALGTNYTYRVVAANTMWTGPPEEVSVKAMRAPDAVTDLALTLGDRLITLNWSAPASDGGSAIVAYVIYRRTPETTFSQLTSTGLLGYADTDLVPGKNYWYYIIPKNELFDGPKGPIRNATALTIPGPVAQLHFEIVDGAVELSWLPPDRPWGAPPTGYVVLRGTTATDLLPIAELGLNLTYRDETVEEGARYYYQVIARSGLGQGEQDRTLDVPFGEAEKASPLPWVALLLVLALVVIGVVAVVYMRRRGETAKALSTVHVVEEVLVVLADGRLIASSWRDESRSRDAGALSGMLAAIQGISREELEHGGRHRTIRYEDNTIVVAAGQQVRVAAVIYGNPSPELTDSLEGTVQEIEASHESTLETWDGDPSAFIDLEGVLRPIVERTRGVTRKVVERAGAAPRKQTEPPHRPPAPPEQPPSPPEQEPFPPEEPSAPPERPPEKWEEMD